MTATPVSYLDAKETTHEPHSRRLLLVENDHEIRGLMRRFFEIRGFQCQGAADAESAERLFQEGPTFDLVVAAANLPVTSGFELLARLRSQCKALPLVLLRGFDGVDTQQNQTEAARLGAHFLAKPIQLSTLLETALAALEEARRSILASQAGAALATPALAPAAKTIGVAAPLASGGAAASAAAPA